MFRSLVRLRWMLPALLAAGLVAAPARSDGPPDPKNIAEIEKQISELQKKLDEAKKAAAQSAASAVVPEAKLREDALKQFKWRNIGPANMGGRVTALAVYEPDPFIYYVATGGGGLLKTTNNGVTFTHCFDDQTTVSIGDVAVSPTDPNTVWVGTGEANPRNSVSYGDGVYKSTDGGKKWENMGLKGSFQTGKILIHPKDPNTVYVGALGRLYGPNPERGLFKTTDAGKTWSKVLFVDDKTGVIDARLDPQDPNTLIVAMWERKRDEFDGFFGDAPVPDSYGPVVTHGPGGGLWKSADGGKTWKKLTAGLPTAKTGRIGLDYSRKTKGLLFAIVDTEKVGTGEAVRRVFLGVVGETADKDSGALLTEISEGGPAEKAGLKAKDVIVKSGDTKITTYESLLEIVRAGKAGDKLKLTVKRDGKEIPIELTLANRPEAAQPTRGGNRLTPPAASTRPLAGVTFGTGTTVSAITAGGGAEKAGMKVGDVVTAVNGKAVATQDEYRAAVGDDKKAGDTLKLTVKRGTETKEYAVVLSGPPAAAGGTGATAATRLMPGFAPEFSAAAAGIKVGTVQKDGPAEKAGIKVGDVVTEVDGKPVESFRDFNAALRTRATEDNPRKAGDKVKVTVKQGEKSLTVELALVEMEAQGPGGGGGGGGPTRGQTAARPYALGLGGQQPNVQDQQGKDSFQTGGIFESRDNGETWKRINSLNPRPMYFSVVRVDPSDDNVLYVLADTPTPIYVSKNGGKRFESLRTAAGVHADAHALWVGATGKQLICGCDGGFYASYDKGEKWEHFNHFALGQFYHVAADNRRPYRVYGGLQDNGSWGGPSNTTRAYGQVNEDWVYVNGGDGFVCRVDPSDPDLVYSESQGGAIARRNFRTGERGFIRPAGRQGDAPYRFNWNTPFILSSANPSIFYSAGDFVFKSVKKGAEAKKISPEITRLKAGSATALAESPLNPDVLWVGTDDGFLWVTKDGGTNWTNVTENLKKGLPGFRYIATLETSKDKEGRCYVAVDAHRSDDDKPYLFVTEDFGATFKPIVGDLPAFGSTRCLREDITNQSILYCGTEFGAYVSLNRGTNWTKLGGNLPTVAVHEIAQTTAAGEVVAATHGRSLWVLDVTSIRQMATSTFTDAATLFTPAPAVRWRSKDGAESPYSVTDKKFVGTNPARGTSLDYYLGKPAEKVSLKVQDVTGKTVRDLSTLKGAGLHRVAWDLAGAPGGGGGGGGGGRRGGGGGIAAGSYRVVLNVDGKEFVQALLVELDPNAPKDLVSLDEEEIETPVNPLRPKRVPLWEDN